MVDAQGKSKNYLFLEKLDQETKKYQDSPSFMPKWNKDGAVSKIIGNYLVKSYFPVVKIFFGYFNNYKIAY